MTEQLKSIIDRLEHQFRLVQETREHDAFATALSEICDELEKMKNSIDAIEPVLALVERSPEH